MFCRFIGNTIRFSDNTNEPTIWFLAVINISFMANASATKGDDASAAKGDVQRLFEFDAVRSLPLLFLKMTAMAPLQEGKEKAASILHFVHSLGGGCWVAFLCALLVKFFV
ncbi:hypothetical protein PIB30_062378 [Stylosanthes scabra]|uniref:Uncharacterized protein n=1 Tax=Stylosanthes scabra TaxID=79078 RepID=A0ABU6VM33_9FABA|nr:hypothetical protein [Stylosanthes scabra]